MSFWNWNDDWVACGEGPLTLLAKFQIANALGADETCRYLFERPTSRVNPFKGHSRSLVHLDWFVPTAESESFAAMVVRRSLTAICGSWSRRLARDRQTRLCLSCLEEGALPAVLQVSGLIRCPLHDVDLTSQCPHCAESTPPYALDPLSFTEPLTCGHCHRPYSEAWSRSAQRLGWAGNRPAPVLDQMEEWLHRISARAIEWPEIRSWSANVDAVDGSASHGSAVLHVLRDVVPGCPEVSGIGPWSPRLEPCIITAGAHDRRGIFGLEERLALYRDLRQQLVEWTACRGSPGTHLYEDPLHDSTGMSIPADDTHHPAWHALHLWRSRFEAINPKHALDMVSAEIEPKHDSFSWPVFCEVSTDTWLSFAIACWIVDLETAHTWLLTLQASPAAASSGRHRWIAERYAESVLFMCPLRRLWPPKVSCLFYRAPDEPERLLMVS